MPKLRVSEMAINYISYNLSGTEYGPKLRAACQAEQTPNSFNQRFYIKNQDIKYVQVQRL